MSSNAIMLVIAAVILLLFKFLHVLIRRKRRTLDIDGLQSEHWLKGNYHRVYQDGRDYNLAMIEKYGGALKIHGLLGQELLYVSDPLALYHIFVKDQEIYQESDMFVMANKLLVGEGLISTLGEQHKRQRKLLNPAFSIANMRELHPLVLPVSEQLVSVVIDRLSKGETVEHNVLPWLARGALEYAAQALIGTTFNAMDPVHTHEWVEAFNKLTPTIVRLIVFRPFVPFVMRHFSLYWRNKIVEWLPVPGLKEMSRIVDVMDRHSRRIFREKQAALHDVNNKDDGNHEKHKNLMNIMMKANLAVDEDEKLSDEELLGQINTILLAASETTPNAMARSLYVLAGRPDEQAKLRREIRATKRAYAEQSGMNTEHWADVKLPYDTLIAMPYLDAVVRETLRVYAPTALFHRVAREEVVLPLHQPVRSASGELMNSVVVPADTTIVTSIIGANHNKEVWGEDAAEWKPERWLADKPPGTSPKGVKYPGTYASMMTFVAGGRACIGFKFAEMEIKQVLTTLLSKLHFSIPVGANGKLKETYWKVNGFHVPVVRPPFGDGKTVQVPLNIRLVRQEDFA